MDKDRLKAVQSLIELSHSLDSVAEQIRGFKWDYEGKPVELTSCHLMKILNAFLDKKMSAADVEQWANLVEGREDISFESSSEEWIGQVIHELANPYLTQPLNENRVRELIADSAKKRIE
jgi:hypothetical protein